MKNIHIAKPVQIHRRTALKSLGSLISLPFLEAMLPVRGARAARAKIPSRMACFYFGTGMNMRQFEPKDEGRDFTFTRILKPLEKHRKDMTVFSGTWLEFGGGHTGDYTFLTGANAHSGGTIKNTISADQIVANQVGGETRFPSLQFAVRRGTNFGSQALHTLSWNKNGIPLASESDPHRIFNRLFKADSPEEAADREAGFRLRGSVLDAVMEQAKGLERKVARGDQEKLDEYFTSVREVEQQLQRNIAWADKPKPEIKLEGFGDYSRPSGPEDVNQNEFSYPEYSKMMYDLIALAFQTDSTRVITMIHGPGGLGSGLGEGPGRGEQGHGCRAEHGGDDEDGPLKVEQVVHRGKGEPERLPKNRKDLAKGRGREGGTKFGKAPSGPGENPAMARHGHHRDHEGHEPLFRKNEQADGG